jgi:hypothetical protein
MIQYKKYGNYKLIKLLGAGSYGEYKKLILGFI